VRRVSRLLVAALMAVVCAQLAFPASRASAAPALSTTRTIAWPLLGLPSSVQLNEVDQTQTYLIPTPSGLHAVALNGVVYAPINFGVGYLEVVDAAGAPLGWVRLPRTGYLGEVHFHVSLRGVPATDGAVTIGLQLRQAGGSFYNHCGIPPQVTVAGLSTAFSGRALAPRTIDAFFPPVLHHVTIYTSATPTAAEQQATLQLTAALVAHYEPLPLAVTVAQLPANGNLPPAQNPLFDRVVVIAQTGGGGIAIIPDGASTALALTGSATTLAVQTALFTEQLADLAQVPNATVTAANAAPQLNTASAYTFSQLGISGSAEVLGQNSLSFSLDQGTLGGPLSSATVHLYADYTPVIAPARGTVVISSGSVVLDTIALNRTGRLATTFTIPRPLMTRKIPITLALTYAAGNVCAATTPEMDFSLEPWSAVTVTTLGAAAGGFNAVPTAFLQGMDVALGQPSISQLSDATEVVAEMQALTVAPLDPQVVSLRAAAASGLGSVIVAGSPLVDHLGLNPPLAGNATALSVDGRSRLRLQLNGGLGSIQSFVENNRTVLLITTTGPWSLLNPLFSDLTSAGWSSLSGDVFVAGPARHPEDLTIRTSGIATFTPSDAGSWELWFVLAFLIAAALGGGALLRWWIRRKPGR